MAIQQCTWKNIRRGLAVGSLIIGGMATGMPENYSKVAFAVALGLSNAAIYIKAEEKEQPDASEGNTG